MAAKSDDPLIQYIVLRKVWARARPRQQDLGEALKWPAGAVTTQACHASSAALWLFREDADTQAYLAELDHMHKCVLAAKDEAQLRAVADSLASGGIAHKLWVRRPRAPRHRLSCPRPSRRASRPSRTASPSSNPSLARSGSSADTPGGHAVRRAVLALCRSRAPE